MNTDTPLTDQHATEFNGSTTGGYASLAFARQLERRAIAAEQEVASLRKALADLVKINQALPEGGAQPH